MKLIVFVAIGGVLSHSRGRLLGKPQNYVRAFQRLYRQYHRTSAATRSLVAWKS
jgi:hypothetical protein